MMLSKWLFWGELYLKRHCAVLPCLPPPSALQTAQDVSFHNVLALFVDLAARCVQPETEEPTAEMDRKSVTLQGIRYLLNQEFPGLGLHSGHAQEQQIKSRNLIKNTLVRKKNLV